MSNIKKTIKGGLTPTPKDSRDFQVGALFKLPSLSELPADFELEGNVIKDQNLTTPDSDYCSAYAADGISELQEGEEMWSEWGFAASKEMTGNPDDWGQDLRTALRRLMKYGSVPAKYKKKVKNPRLFSSYPESVKKHALKHRKQTYVIVKKTQGMDYFDSIRATIWRFKEEKRAVAFGVQFSWSLSDVIIDSIDDGYGHAMRIIGWKTVNGDIYAKVANSYGRSAGENGYHYMSRKVINHYANIYGAYTVVDLRRDEAEFMLKNGIKAGDSWLVVAFKRLIATIGLSTVFTEEEKDVLLDKTTEVMKNEVKKIEPKPISLQAELLKLATESLGKNVRSGTAPMDLGCADALSSVLGHLIPFQNEISTARLNKILRSDKRLKSTLDLTPGNIIMSPTNGTSIGHCGVILEGGKIASNNSNTGLWSDHFTIESWVARYRKDLGLPIYVYQIK